MNKTLLKLYQSLPYPAQCVAAAGWGRYLRSWRYGAVTDRLVQEALRFEASDPRIWEEVQQAGLSRQLRHASRRVPYYRRLLGEAEPASRRRLEDWPVLRRESLQRDSSEFLADDARRPLMYREYTSGSTSAPVSVWLSRETLLRWYALVEARIRIWNGVDRGQRWGIFGGQPICSADRRHPPFWVWNRSMKQLYLSSYHLAKRNAAAYLEAIERYGLRYLLGYSSALSTLAQFATEEGLRVPDLAVIVCNGEPLLRSQRTRIEEAFRCPVRETYGQAEIVCGASECEAGSLHLWPEVGVVEILDDQDRPVPRGETGRLVCTGLLSSEMPLIRYDTGDRASLPEGGFECDCQRRLPVLAGIEGRQDDLIVTLDGRRVGRLDPVFKAQLPIREAQIVQPTRDRLVVRVVPAEGFSRRHEVEMLGRLAERVGRGMKLDLERVAGIERGGAGKFRAVISLLGEDDDPTASGL